MKPTLKERVYGVPVETDKGELVDCVVAVFLIILILLNVAAVIVGSDADMAAHFAPLSLS